MSEAQETHVEQLPESVVDAPVEEQHQEPPQAPDAPQEPQVPQESAPQESAPQEPPAPQEQNDVPPPSNAPIYEGEESHSVQDYQEAHQHHQPPEPQPYYPPPPPGEHMHGRPPMHHRQEGELSNTRLFVRPFPLDVQESELNEIFGPFGPMKEVKILNGFAFVEFEEAESAAKAIEEVHGKSFANQPLEVVYSKLPAKRYRITMKNLPEGCSWQDLKDLARENSLETTFLASIPEILMVPVL